MLVAVMWRPIQRQLWFNSGRQRSLPAERTLTSVSVISPLPSGRKSSLDVFVVAIKSHRRWFGRVPTTTSEEYACTSDADLLPDIHR